MRISNIVQGEKKNNLVELKPGQENKWLTKPLPRAQKSDPCVLFEPGHEPTAGGMRTDEYQA